MTEPQLRALRLLVSKQRLSSAVIHRYAIQPMDMQVLVDLGAAEEIPPYHKLNGSTIRFWRPTMIAKDVLDRASTSPARAGKPMAKAPRVGFRPPQL